MGNDVKIRDRIKSLRRVKASDLIGNAVDTVNTLAPHVTDSIWIGKMNQIESRTAPGTSALEIARIMQGQTDDAVHIIYESLKHHPLIRWKESYKTVLGISLAQQAGLDV